MEATISKSIQYRLGKSPAVDANALEVLGGRQPGLDRSLAFLVLDSQLRRLAKAFGVLNLALGRALPALLAGGYEALGFGRVDDYCIEQLGFGRRAAELLKQQAERLDRHPVIRTAYIEGRINESQARLLLAHVEQHGGDEAALAALAATLTVRALKKELRAIADGEAPPPVPEAIVNAEAVAEAGDAAGEALVRDGVWLRYNLTPEQMADWEAVSERCCRLAGGELKPFQVLEILAAEFLAGAPTAAEAETPDAGCAYVQRPQAAGAASHGPIDVRWDRQGSGPHTDWRAVLEDAAHCWRWLESLPVQVQLDGELAANPPQDPLEAHEFIRNLVLCRRRLDIYIGRMLRTLADFGLARQGLFASICHYSAERLGLGASTTSRAIGRERRLAVRPKVFQAIVDGRIGLTQADLILQLPDCGADDEWIAFAEIRTCRGLEDAVRDARLIRSAAPAGQRDHCKPPSESGPVVDPESGNSGVSMFSSDGTSASLRVFVPSEILPVVQEAEAAACRLAGRPLSSEECLVLFIAAIEQTYTEFERRLEARRRRALGRSRFRCSVPGCRARRDLHVHHVEFRSQGGSDDDDNLVVLCPYHHLRGVHEGRLRIEGRPGERVYELGIRNGKPAMVFRGEVRIA